MTTSLLYNFHYIALFEDEEFVDFFTAIRADLRQAVPCAKLLEREVTMRSKP
jgi:hypothetical protein